MGKSSAFSTKDRKEREDIMTKLKDVLELLENADRIRIIRGAGEELYTGFKGTCSIMKTGWKST